MTVDDDLLEALALADPSQLPDLVASLPLTVVQRLTAELASSGGSAVKPSTPLAQAQALDEGYRERVHLKYLSDRLAQAVADVEAGQSRWLIVSMPPRMGKSYMTSDNFPTWLLSKHPDWKIGLISHSPTLAVGWGRQVRRRVEEHGEELGIAIARDAGAASEWQTTAGGGVVSRSAPGQSITGLGFKVMLLDDLVKDYAAAHSKVQRDAIWAWWYANAFTRLEPPSLVVVVGTRWHEDDIIGRLLSKEYGDPDRWEVIDFPAIAETDDVLGRVPGQPLYSPLLEETELEALDRWSEVKRAVGSYMWQALYQQRPAPSQGAVFSADWWRFWTTSPATAEASDGRVVYFDPSEERGGRWLDSWDFTFKGSDRSDFVVGQRWLALGPNRYLIAQQRDRWNFTEQLDHMKWWSLGVDAPHNPYGSRVHQHLVEDAANGTAIIDVMRKEVSGIKAIKPRTAKELRARAITPEVESGNVYLPYPGDPGNEWVTDLLSELRDFPFGAHDDQVDALSQALNELRGAAGTGGVVSPNRVATTVQPLSGASSRVSAANSMRPRSGGGYRRTVSRGF